LIETLSKEEEARFLKTLEEDFGFRYAVSGLIGLREVSDRFDRVENEIKLWERQNKLWEKIKGLQLNFKQLGNTFGIGLEHYTVAFLEKYLSEKGLSEEKINVKINVTFMYKGEFLEANLINEDPVIIDEVTAYLTSAREAEELLERAEIAQEIYGKKPELLILAVMNVNEKSARKLEKLAEKEIKTVIGWDEILNLLNA
jgi:reverse gyrase